MKGPAILFCYEQFANEYEQDMYANIIKDKAILEGDVLQRLEESINLKFPLLIVSDIELMRAIDYRAPNLGIMLIIAKPFDHYR